MKFWILKKSKTLMEKKFLAKKIYKKELQEKKPKIVWFEKAIKRKSYELYSIWKGCDNSYKNRIDKKDIAI